MKVLKKIMSVLLLTTPAIFCASENDGGLKISEPDCAALSTAGIAAGSPRSDSGLLAPIDLEITTTTTLLSMLPHLAEGSRSQIEEVIAILQGPGYQKFKDAETKLRTCEITPSEDRAEEGGSPVHIEETDLKKNQRLLNKDVLHVLRSLEVYIRDLPTEDDYDADVESPSVDSGSSKNFG